MMQMSFVYGMSTDVCRDIQKGVENWKLLFDTTASIFEGGEEEFSCMLLKKD